MNYSVIDNNSKRILKENILSLHQLREYLLNLSEKYERAGIDIFKDVDIHIEVKDPILNDFHYYTLKEFLLKFLGQIF